MCRRSTSSPTRVDIVFTADPDKDRAENIAKTLKTESDIDILTDYRAGLDRIDTALILVPHLLHHPITMDALRTGCHVLLEKPFALTLDEADDMIAEADKRAKNADDSASPSLPQKHASLQTND